ncbi:AlpA family phage regulatory protein [Variovorax dokdonensis]|uniref:AlpA family phage regulatory protein n=1 Tax=Variovorax dokdonensis TaxID=344883 RepID=A0ABT7N736_9BURK|nr:AlpA family phage regulatory protein [Variovorax dokdonensis]MDM0043753.1 AlpA family phage regulatory protein [Variovorax dokdonensis]
MDTPAQAKRSRFKQPVEAASNPAALLRIETVQALTGLGRSSIYARVKEGSFPHQISLSTRCSRWRAGDVAAWLESQ